MKNLLLNQLRKDYLKFADEEDKKNHYAKLGEISYYNLIKEGVKNFRNSSSGCGLGYADNIIINSYVTSISFKRLLIWFFNIISFNRIFSQQKILTKRLFNDRKKYLNYIFSTNKKTIQLIKKYKIINSTLFGCDNVFTYKKKNYSPYYLELCNKIDFISSKQDLHNIRTFCEIGGGFGANIHLILQNFKNIKKVLLIDTFPTIYVASEYLKFFYGKSVITYSSTINKKKIEFTKNNKLEIICIPSWQINEVETKIDYFHNGDSFSHLDIKKIKKYANFLKKNKTKFFSITDLELLNYKKYKITAPQKYIKLFNNNVKPLANDFVIKGLRNEKNIYFLGTISK